MNEHSNYRKNELKKERKRTKERETIRRKKLDESKIMQKIDPKETWKC
jgi:hypothetical protein